MSAVFSMDKYKVRQSFAKAAKSYDSLAGLQRNVGTDLFSRFSLENVIKQTVLESSNQTILDIGCGTGFLTQQLTEQALATNMVALDIALPMLQVTRSKLADKKSVQYICADAEFLPIADHTIDIIVSNLALQWCDNLTQVFTGLKKSLKPKGQLFFSTFGPSTLQELKQAWSEVDDYSHVNEFYTTEELALFIQQTGFEEISIESKSYQANYQSVFELMRELKGIGAHTVLKGGNQKMTTKSTMRHMITAYDKHRIYGMIPATYDVIFVTAKI